MSDEQLTSSFTNQCSFLAIYKLTVDNGGLFLGMEKRNGLCLLRFVKMRNDSPNGCFGGPGFERSEARCCVEKISTDWDGQPQPHMVQGATGNFDMI